MFLPRINQLGQAQNPMLNNLGQADPNEQLAMRNAEGPPPDATSQVNASTPALLGLTANQPTTPGSEGAWGPFLQATQGHNLRFGAGGINPPSNMQTGPMGPGTLQSAPGIQPYPGIPGPESPGTAAIQGLQRANRLGGNPRSNMNPDTPGSRPENQ